MISIWVLMAGHHTDSCALFATVDPLVTLVVQFRHVGPERDGNNDAGVLQEQTVAHPEFSPMLSVLFQVKWHL